MKESTKVKLVVLIAILVAAAIPMAAQTAPKSGTINIAGVVPEIFELTVTQAPDAGSLDLTSPISDHTIATIKERSNKKLGYVLSLTSGNSFRFKGFASSDYLTYSLKYDGTAVDLSGTTATLNDANGKTTGNPAAKTLALTFDGETNFPSQDSYSDVLTLTMTAK